MKIVLSTTPNEGQYVNWTTHKYFQVDKVNKYMPLGILSLATNIPQEHDIKVIDPSSEGWTIDETVSIIESEEPDILGLSVVTRKTYGMMELLKRINVPYIAVGGPHATYYSKQILKFGANIVFVGALTDLEFADNLKNKKTGIIYCNTKINDIKYPNRHYLNVEDYYPKESKLFKAPNRLPIFSSIGCPNRCNFCNVQSKKLQFKKPKITLDEMEYLQSIGCKSIHMLDDNFNVSKKHLKGILDEMDRRGFCMEWSGRGQTKMDFSLLPRLESTHFKRIHVGIEALDNSILRFFNKNETEDDIIKFCREMNNHNIDILAYFILGSPMETKGYRKTLPDKIRELNIKHPFINILFPEPDTNYYYSLLRKRLFKKDHWKEYMENPTPNYELPFPYNNKEELFNDVEEIVNEFR